MRSFFTSTGATFTAANGETVAYQPIFEAIVKSFECYYPTKGWFLSVEDMENLVQDTFLKAIKNHASYDPRKSSPTTWASMLARSVQIDAFNRYCSREIIPVEQDTDQDVETMCTPVVKYVRRRVPFMKKDEKGGDYLNPDCERPASGCYEADLLTERNEIKGMVNNALGSLSESNRQILSSNWEGAKPKEIAEQLGCTPGAVSTRLHRANKALKEAFDPCVVAEYDLSA
jgi:RNA polymerase sigma factor (sigma-70 family)